MVLCLLVITICHMACSAEIYCMNFGDELWRTLECHYNKVQFIMILHTALPWQPQNVNQNLNSQQTPHILPSWVSYEVSFMGILEKIDPITNAPHFIQYIAQNWPWYSLRGLHIRITCFSLYGIRLSLFSLYGIHMPLFPYMVIQPIVLGVALLWAAMDSPLSQGPLLWHHNDMTVIVSQNTHWCEWDTWQRLDNANVRRLQTFSR